jgi:hypothetical protein
MLILLQELKRDAITAALDGCLVTEEEHQVLLAAAESDTWPEELQLEDPLFDDDEEEEEEEGEEDEEEEEGSD